MTVNTYTAFCKQANGQGTTWIGTVEAETAQEAAEKAPQLCAADWGWDHHSGIAVLGIAYGDVDIAFWED